MPHLLIAGSYSGLNKGDTAILLSMIVGIRKRRSDVNIYVQSKYPGLLRTQLGREGASGIHIHKSVTNYLGIFTLPLLLKADYIVFGGGGLFFSRELFNPFKNHLINLFVLSLLSLLFRVKYSVIGVGASEKMSWIGKKMTQLVLHGAEYVTVRDALSYQQLYLLSGESTKVKLTADFVFSQASKKVSNRSKLRRANDILVVLHNGMMKHTEFHYENLLNMLYSLSGKYNLEIVENSVNQSFANTVRADLQLNFGVTSTNTFPALQDLDASMSYYSKFNNIVTIPMHAAIFAIQIGKTPIMIGYDQKVAEVATALGLEKKVIHSLSADEVIKAGNRTTGVKEKLLTALQKKSQENFPFLDGLKAE